MGDPYRSKMAAESHGGGKLEQQRWQGSGLLRLALAFDRQMRAGQTKTVQTSNRTFFRNRFRFSAKSETESGQCQPKQAHRTCVKTAVEGQGWLRYGGHGAAAEQGFCGILHLKLVTTAPTQPTGTLALQAPWLLCLAASHDCLRTALEARCPWCPGPWVLTSTQWQKCVVARTP